MTEPRLLHGTAGWSYRDWLGPFYARGTRPGDYLRRYAEVFPAVEVDSSYYAIPSPDRTAAWAERTPEDFVFSPKMVGTVTHELLLERCDDVVEAYLRAFAPLGPKLGPIVLQFPRFAPDSGVNLALFATRMRRFLERTLPAAEARVPAPKARRWAVEVRNREFLAPELIELLRERGVALVIVDHAAMPDPWDWLDEQPLEHLFTGSVVPIRLIGDRHGIEEMTTSWDRLVVDRSKRLAAWAEVIRRAMGRGLTVTAFANNHFAGHGPATAAALAGLLGVGDGRVPSPEDRVGGFRQGRLFEG